MLGMIHVKRLGYCFSNSNVEFILKPDVHSTVQKIFFLKKDLQEESVIDLLVYGGKGKLKCFKYLEITIFIVIGKLYFSQTHVLGLKQYTFLDYGCS